MLEYKIDSIHDDCTYIVNVGQNAEENWKLIDQSAQNDIWFHVENHPSCHVVLSVNNNKNVPHKSVLKRCATICKDGSKLRSNHKVKIIYTFIKNVKKAKDIGSVYTTNDKNIII